MITSQHHTVQSIFLFNDWINPIQEILL